MANFIHTTSNEPQTAETGHQYLKLAIKDIVASNLPKLEKTSGWSRKVVKRDLRLVFTVDSIKQELPWKVHEEQLKWLEKEYAFPAARTTSLLYFEIRAKYSHGESERTILQSAPATVASIVEGRTEHDSITINLNPTDPSTADMAHATLSIIIEATKMNSENLDASTRIVFAELEPRDKWASMIDPLKKVLALGKGISELEIHAKVALACVQIVCDILVKPLELYGKVLELMDAVAETLCLVLESDSELDMGSLTQNQRRILPKLMHQANECILFAHDFVLQSYLKTAAKATITDYDSIIADYTRVMGSLKNQFLASELRDTQVVVHRLQSKLDKIELKIDALQLARLEITKGAGRDPTKVCLNGTRVKMLEKIRAWIHGAEQTRMFLLIGQAGVGKSAIAHTIANEYAELGRLGSAFCFSKDRGSANLFRTIARDLADMDPMYAAVLSSKVTSEMEGSEVAEIQMKKILLPPFDALSVVGPIVIVIDALDECVNRDPIVKCLINNANALPANIRILITSRPSEAQDLRACGWVQICELERLSDEDEDLVRYVEDQLQKYRKILEPGDVKAIVFASEGLFQYASVVCKEMLSSFKYRTHESPEQTFTRLVKGTKAGLDGLYTGILENLYHNANDSDSDTFRVFRHVMSWILVAQDRFTHASLVDLGRGLVLNQSTQAGYDPVSMTLRPLGALFSGTQDPSEIVYPLHSSFRNFLLDPERSGRFYVGSAAFQHASISSASLRLLVKALRFNIADLETSYLLNRDVPHFEERVLSRVPRSLSYACAHWATHLSKSSCPEDRFECTPEIVLLLDQKFLFWLEVLGLENSVSSAETSLQFLSHWTKGNSELSLRYHRVSQCLSFIRDFMPLINASTPHLYISALALAPDILPGCRSMFKGLPSIAPELGILKLPQQGLLMTLRGHTGCVNAFAFSPDGNCIASASFDGDVQLWDARTGLPQGASFSAHKGGVTSVSFSLDGNRIVTASTDGTVRLWDVRKREEIGASFSARDTSRLFSRRVDSAAFSADGTKILTLSRGRYNPPPEIWDVQTGTVQLDSPLFNLSMVSTLWRLQTTVPLVPGFLNIFDGVFDSSRISSFAFSPDGQLVVFITKSYTVEVWEVQTRELVSSLSTDPVHLVTLASFSPDGDCILSISSPSADKSIRVWDVKTGLQIGAFFGHEDHIYSACFSPDGRFIVSGSSDTTVRVWDANRGMQGANPLPQQRLVHSAHFSPNGREAIVVYRDGTIQTWDLQTGEAFDAPISVPRGITSTEIITAISFSTPGKYIAFVSNTIIQLWNLDTQEVVVCGPHKGPINSISFSSDGTQVVSTSDDRTIRRWSVETGMQVGHALSDLQRPVTAASFSHDGKLVVFLSLNISRRSFGPARKSELCVWDVREHSYAVRGKVDITENDLMEISTAFAPEGNKILLKRRYGFELFDARTGVRKIQARYPTSSMSWDYALPPSLQAALPPAKFKEWIECPVSFSPDGKQIAYPCRKSEDHVVFQICDMETGLLVCDPLYGGYPQAHQVCSSAFSPDGKLLVSTSSNQTLRVWDAQTGEPIGAPLFGHQSTVLSATFSADGKQILSTAKSDTTVRVWNVDAISRIQKSVTDSPRSQRPYARMWPNVRALNLQDGWFRTWTDNHLMLWIPPAYRDLGFLMSSVHAGVLGVPNVRIEWENRELFHGPNWAKCYTGDL